MENEKEIKPILEYTNEAGTQFFGEGDAVICFTENKRYTGTIVALSNYIIGLGHDKEKADIIQRHPRD